MLKLIFANGRFAPIIFCDNCGQPITDARVASALFLQTSPFGTPPQEGAIAECDHHAHNGACADVVEAMLGDTDDVGRLVLSEFLAQLPIVAGGLDWRAVAEAADLLTRKSG